MPLRDLRIAQVHSRIIESPREHSRIVSNRVRKRFEHVSKASAKAFSKPSRKPLRCFGVHPSSYYAWCISPESPRTEENKRLVSHIKQSWLESGAVYGYRKVYDDLQELGEQCRINRVHRLMRADGIRSQTGYAKRKWKRGGAPSVIAPNHLQREFGVAELNKVSVTDITYLRTYEG